MDRRDFMTATASAAVLLAGGSAKAQNGLRKVTVAQAGDALHYFPFYVARGVGHFAEEGLDVDWVNLNSGPKQAAAVMGGTSEFAPMGLLHVIKSAVEGANMVAVSSVFSGYGMSLALSNEAIQKAGIQLTMPIDEKVRRLKGLKIAISSPGGSSDMLVRTLMAKRGLDPDRELQLQTMGNGAAMFAAFEKKVVDGFVWTAPFPELVETKGLGKNVVNPFSGEVPELSSVLYVVMATTRQTLARHPDVIAAATRAVTKSLKFCRDKPDETRRVVGKFFPQLDPSIADVALENYRRATATTPVITPANVRGTADWMALAGGKPINVKFEDVVSAEIAHKAAAQILR
jgi:NitT/TauT family transport system substrate-binding protein